jgi:hypothetical protein
VSQVTCISPKSLLMTTARLCMSTIACAVLALVAIPGVTAATISQGYKSDQQILAGTMVASEGSSGKAVPADITNAGNLLGVVVEGQEATLAISASGDQLQVATNGASRVFVSNLGGDIKAGDPVGPSPIKGVGMRVAVAGKIIGIAQADATYGSQTAPVANTDNQVTEAKLGTVPVALQVSYFTPPPEKTWVPQVLQELANSVAGKQVSLIRLLISALLLLAAIISDGILLFSAARNTIISVGRNPLATGTIYKSLWQVVLTTIVIFAAGAGSAYLVLTR